MKDQNLLEVRGGGKVNSKAYLPQGVHCGTKEKHAQTATADLINSTDMCERCRGGLIEGMACGLGVCQEFTKIKKISRKGILDRRSSISKKQKHESVMFENCQTVLSGQRPLGE